jgi:hypothetical protein
MFKKLLRWLGSAFGFIKDQPTLIIQNPTGKPYIISSKELTNGMPKQYISEATFYVAGKVNITVNESDYALTLVFGETKTLNASTPYTY